MTSKYFKNPDRNLDIPKIQPYIPQYKQMGLQPMERETPLIIPKQKPYAEMPLAIPNVGNVQSTWIGFDEHTLDDDGKQVKIDSNRSMIDNNNMEEEVVNSFSTNNGLGTMEKDDVVLIVKGEVISVEKMDFIEKEVEALIYEQHPLSKNSSITIDDIIVLKRIPIKIGVFLGE